MKLWGKILGIGMMITTTAAMATELTLAPLFSDQMVLQREQPVAIWGQATPGTVVNIQLQDHVDATIPNAQGKAIADNSGRWQATLPALPAGGPFTLITSTDQQQLTVKDIWLGDVWLASGQSNMEWPLS
ncbi:MAG: hypothetical protein KKF79_00350, partial [Gammaproteobacteria bacterium]|nr:hypothetical protein [Gammaproteobacteria bacterium]